MSTGRIALQRCTYARTHADIATVTNMEISCDKGLFASKHEMSENRKQKQPPTRAIWHSQKALRRHLHLSIISYVVALKCRYVVVVTDVQLSVATVTAAQWVEL